MTHMKIFVSSKARKVKWPPVDVDAPTVHGDCANAELLAVYVLGCAIDRQNYLGEKFILEKSR